MSLPPCRSSDSPWWRSCWDGWPCCTPTPPSHWRRRTGRSPPPALPRSSCWPGSPWAPSSGPGPRNTWQGRRLEMTRDGWCWIIFYITSCRILPTDQSNPLVNTMHTTLSLFIIITNTNLYLFRALQLTRNAWEYHSPRTYTRARQYHLDSRAWRPVSVYSSQTPASYLPSHLFLRSIHLSPS